jgi:hypothetical protein
VAGVFADNLDIDAVRGAGFGDARWYPASTQALVTYG